MKTNEVIKCLANPCWRIIPSDCNDIYKKDEEEEIFGYVKQLKTIYGDNLNRFYAQRTMTTYKDNITIIYDEIKTDFSACIYTSFDLSDKKNLSCNIADKHRVVIRGKEFGAKIFRMACILDEKDEMASAGLMLPDKNCNNNEITMTFYDGLHNFCKKHIAIYCIITDINEKVGKWHFKDINKQGFIIEPPFKQSSDIIVSIERDNISFLEK